MFKNFKIMFVALALCVVSLGLAMDVNRGENRVKIVLVNDYANNLNFTVQTAAGAETYPNVLPTQSHMVGYLDKIVSITVAGVSGWQGKTKTVSQADLQGCWNRKSREGRNTMRIPISKFYKSVPWAGIRLTWDCEAVNYEMSATKETEENTTTVTQGPIDLNGKTAWQILRLDAGASKADALKKIKELSLLFHPDKFDQNSQKLAQYGITSKKQAEAVMVKINEARSMLSKEQ